MSTRRAPTSRDDAMYERLIEIQERQAAIATEQTTSRTRQDLILDKLTDMLGQIAKLLESRTIMFDEMRQGVENIPTVAQMTSDRIVGEVKTHLDVRAKALVYWLALATFAGSLLGNAGHSLIDWLFKLIPK